MPRSDEGLGSSETLDGSGGPGSARRLAAPTHIGRYALLRWLGAGAMGYVHAAYDETLDRKVAIKLIRDDHAHSPLARERLLREAKAMARLSHPNVAHVYEAGEHAGRVYLVMEFVTGTTLRTWLTAAPRNWRAIVDMFVRVGAGLAAAHHAGVTHRDFKPDNVLVTTAGEPKVLDFGLADLGSVRGTTADLSQIARFDREAIDITCTGAMLGTPAYMSPEQHAGEHADELADQFAFCVALFEALHGRRPFLGSTLGELAANIGAGQVAPLPAGTGVPAWLHAIALRGLAVDRRARFASMDALLVALRDDPSLRRRRLAFGVAAIAALAAGTIAWSTRGHEVCTSAAAQLAGVWNADRRWAFATAMQGTGAAYASATVERTSARLDAYAATWIAGHEDACLATSVRAEQSTKVMDLRMACLQRAKLDLAATVTVLEHADADVVAHADDAVAGLPSIERCADVDALQADVPPPLPSERDAVTRVEELIATGVAQSDAGRYPQAVATLEGAAVAASGLAYVPVRGELQVALGIARDGDGDFVGAEAALRTGIAHATEAGDWRRTYRGTLALTKLLAELPGRAGEALAYADLAVALAQRVHEPRDRTSAALSRAFALVRMGSYEPALAAFDELIPTLDGGTPEDETQLAAVRHSLALALFKLGRFADAELEVRRALETLQLRLGAEHPRTLASLGLLANCLLGQGDPAGAEAHYRRAIELTAATQGTEHTRLPTLRGNLAVALRRQGKLADAEAEIRAAIAGSEAAFGADDERTGALRNNLALILLDQGAHAEAAAILRELVTLLSRKSPVDEQALAETRGNLGLAYVGQGRFDAAQNEYRVAADLMRRRLGSDHPSVLLARGNLGDLLLKQGRVAEAEVELRAAIEGGDIAYGADHELPSLWRTVLAEAITASQPNEALSIAEAAWAARLRQPTATAAMLGETAFVLAQALWRTGDRARARTLAETARSHFAAGEGDERRRIAAVDAWLAARD